MTNSQRLADSVVLLIVARVSMVLALPTIGLVAWLYSSWQDDRLDSIRDQMRARKARPPRRRSWRPRQATRLIAVETRQTQVSASSDRFQAATLSRLDRVQDSIVGAFECGGRLDGDNPGNRRERPRETPCAARAALTPILMKKKVRVFERGAGFCVSAWITFNASRRDNQPASTPPSGCPISGSLA
jgi:hypothetical protein